MIELHLFCNHKRYKSEGTLNITCFALRFLLPEAERWRAHDVLKGLWRVLMQTSVSWSQSVALTIPDMLAGPLGPLAMGTTRRHSHRVVDPLWQSCIFKLLCSPHRTLFLYSSKYPRARLPRGLVSQGTDVFISLTQVASHLAESHTLLPSRRILASVRQIWEEMNMASGESRMFTSRNRASEGVQVDIRPSCPLTATQRHSPPNPQTCQVAPFIQHPARGQGNNPRGKTKEAFFTKLYLC